MIQSTITAKYQITVPKEIRHKLGIGPRDVLRWEVIDGAARVTVARRGFLERRGSIRVGSSAVVDDVRRARLQRSTEAS